MKPYTGISVGYFIVHKKGIKSKTCLLGVHEVHIF